MTDYSSKYKEEFEHVNNYLEEKKIKEYINEIVNDTLRIRPDDPYMHMSNLFKKISCSSKGFRSIVPKEIMSSTSYPAIEYTIITETGTYKSSSSTIVRPPHLPGAISVVDTESELFNGHSLLNGITAINTDIIPLLMKKTPSDQQLIDELLINLNENNEKKSKYGSNFILGLSQCILYAGAGDLYISPINHILSLCENKLEYMPIPIITLLSRHPKAPEGIFIDKIRILTQSTTNIRQNIRILNEVRDLIYHALKEKDPDFGSLYTNDSIPFIPISMSNNNEDITNFILSVIRNSSYNEIIQIYLKFDVDKYYSVDGDKHGYRFTISGKKPPLNKKKEFEPHPSSLLQTYYSTFIQAYPEVVYIENPLGYEDLPGYKELNTLIGPSKFLISSTYTSGNIERLSEGIQSSFRCSIIRPHEIGTVWECILYNKLCVTSNVSTIVDTTLNTTCDPFSVYLSVGIQSKFVIFGSFYSQIANSLINQLINVDEERENK